MIVGFSLSRVVHASAVAEIKIKGGNLIERSCKECVYLQRDPTASGGLGFCHRNPPRENGYEPVQPTWWCGEYRTTWPPEQVLAVHEGVEVLSSAAPVPPIEVKQKESLRPTALPPSSKGKK
jgi:hypothetical protein